jgi:hypothetical protein
VQLGALAPAVKRAGISAADDHSMQKYGVMQPIPAFSIEFA